MDCSNLTAAPAKTAANPSPESQSPPPSTSPPPPMVMSPCAACKILRRRCAEKCVLAPYFPPSEPYKFSIAHRVFGASNIIKFLQELPESQRADAVSSMVYEANARIRDPVYGCAGAIFQLQKQVSQLQAELAKAQAELMTTHSHQANLVALLCMEMSPMEPSTTTSYQDRRSPPDSFISSGGSFFDDNNNSNNSLSLWDPLWT